MKQTTLKTMLLILLSTAATAATPSTLLLRADMAYQDMKFALAAADYEVCLKDPALSTAAILPKLANCYWQMRDANQALRVYQLVYPNGSQGASLQDQLRIGELYARKEQYPEAAEWLKAVPGYAAKATAYTEKETLNTMRRDSLKWKIGFLNINTPYKEFSPFILRNTLFFSSNKPLESKTQAYGWDGNNTAHLWEIPLSKTHSLTVEELKDSTYFKLSEKQKKPHQLAGIYECGDSKSNSSVFRLLLRKPFIKGHSATGSLVKGLERNSNASTISVDKYNQVYFSSNAGAADKQGIQHICLMQGLYTPAGIREIRPLPLGNDTAYSLMHPAVSAEGTFLVCSSDKQGGKGAYDLYYTQRKNIRQTWDSLKAFGSNVNTLGNEVFPNLTPNGYLYFSSDALPGLGGLDIFRIPLKEAIAGTGEPEHLTYPINSAADDFGWAQKDSTGAKGYFTSDRLNNNDNIYSFDYEQIKSSKKIKVGFVWQLSNVHYDFDKSELRTDAKPILDSLVLMSNEHYITIDSLVLVLNENPITIEIGSHTDSRGSYDYNMKLAQRRAESVVAYLVQHGIDPKRITAKSYGKARLLKKEESTAADFQANRRAEVKVTGYDKR